MLKKRVWSVYGGIILLSGGVSIYTLHFVGPEVFLGAVIGAAVIIASAFVGAWFIKNRLAH